MAKICAAAGCLRSYRLRLVRPVEFCLNAVLTCLAPGGIIALDDYHDYGGCRAATDELLGAHPDVFAVDDGPNLILRRVQLR